MKRKDYIKPIMNFNPGLEKYEPDIKETIKTIKKNKKARKQK
jgi:hypothetical protein